MSDAVERVLDRAVKIIFAAWRNEYLTPEHVLLSLLEEERFAAALGGSAPVGEVKALLEQYLGSLDKTDDPELTEVVLSYQMQEVYDILEHTLRESSAEKIDVPHLAKAILELEDSWGAKSLYHHLPEGQGEFMASLVRLYDSDNVEVDPAWIHGEDPDFFDLARPDDDWRNFVVCLNENLEGRMPLVGREKELERTVRVLCRRDKNNPLHVGEPGVGKTALVWGLARMIEDGRVPERLRGSKIYMMDLTSLIAGTQYRGDFEKRLKDVVDGVGAEAPNNIIYIDEIHMLVGAGATGGDVMDASNILKPALETGRLRFIGSTTYEEFNRQFSKSKGLLRRFQQIDIEEPSPEDALVIIRQLQPFYEDFHRVTYTREAIEFAVRESARHISGRCLPDKAIDLVDEAGAAMQTASEKKPIDVKEIADVLAGICKVDALAVAEKDDFRRLESLSERMLSSIFGQDGAVSQVVESVQMARAGLLDAEKPLASMLFVGPTGVGKTELARALARELGVEMIRFDMSEYAEKHSVAKLIGAPAGYVGYDDGGLLTDAVRKSPGCVLLLDEIEKAHEDIYNILLQVMDYGRLTDNKGRAADFRNVILLMTSNAGAQYASRASVGFASSATRGDAMMRQVKKTFKPEFLNRLSGIAVFNDMNRDMASRILRKKISDLEKKLAEKSVTLTLSAEAFSHLLDEGFTAEYGAREIDRVLRRDLNPLLMREILFGSLRTGGHASVSLSPSRRLTLDPNPEL